MAMDKEACKALLPNVGDELVRKPYSRQVLLTERPKPQRCVVVYVNRDHLWYRVRFDSGIHECYKVPDIEYKNKGGWDSK